MAKNKNIVSDEYGRAYEMGKVLGQGGQGVVCIAKDDSRFAIKFRMQSDDGQTQDSDNNKEVAILYDDEIYAKYAKKIHRLIAIENLFKPKNVAFPVAMLQKPYCGYVMRFMDGMTSLASMFTPANIKPTKGTNGSLEKKFTVLKNLAETLRQLHSSGLVYCDLSPNNVFVSSNAKDSEVWLIDADNIKYANKSGKVIGTPGYRAPEIASMAQANSPKSDIYSFALIAFEYLTGNSPFDETAVDSDDDDWDDYDIFTYESGNIPYVYEFDTDAKGRLPLGYVCTPKMAELFFRTFCIKGRSKPFSRPTASEWVEALDEACHCLCVCAHEDKHVFLAPDCAWCKHYGEHTDMIAVYKLTAIYLPKALEETAWDEEPPVYDHAGFEKSKYFSCRVGRKDKVSISKSCIIPQSVKCDFENVNVTIDKNSTALIEDCRFKSQYDGHPLAVNEAISGKVTCRDALGAFDVTIVLERVK